MERVHQIIEPEGVEIGSILQLIGRRISSLEDIGQAIHALNKRWWHDPRTGEPLQRNVSEMLMLTVSELSEAMEGHRKNKMDDHLPHRKMLEVELADAMIRILDLGYGLGLDVAGAMMEKLEYNVNREDHKPENRLKPGGKAF